MSSQHYLLKRKSSPHNNVCFCGSVLCVYISVTKMKNKFDFKCQTNSKRRWIPLYIIVLILTAQLFHAGILQFVVMKRLKFSFQFFISPLYFIIAASKANSDAGRGGGGDFLRKGIWKTKERTSDITNNSNKSVFVSHVWYKNITAVGFCDDILLLFFQTGQADADPFLQKLFHLNTVISFLSLSPYYLKDRETKGFW